MANIGYIQVVRHCNHFCGFCSNPTTPYEHTLETMRELVDDFVRRGYFGVILTGGEPTLHPQLPDICAYAREQGLHVRMITNGHRLADPDFAKSMAGAGLQLAHISVYSVRPEIEEKLRGTAGTLERAYRAVENAHRFGIGVNINCVINRLNADHLDEGVRYWIDNHPEVRHFVWNNLDPSMGRAEVNQKEYTPRLAQFEASLFRALTLLEESGRTFRVEKVPLCYMADFAWASTETRKIVKGEERIVHFLDAKQTVRQTNWEHVYSDACDACSLRRICGGLFDRGNGYDPAELQPVFISEDAVVQRIIQDPSDPSFPFRNLHAWKRDFDERCRETVANVAKVAGAKPNARLPVVDGPAVGRVTDRAQRLFDSKRRTEAKKAAALGVEQERSEEP